MTFGQHLEELRRCLFKAILALAIGCGIGLIPPVSVPVVDFAKLPVEHALADYYQKAAGDKRYPRPNRKYCSARPAIATMPIWTVLAKS